MKETPSAKDAFSERTTSKASRVLPTPPGPSRVSKRTSGCLSRSMTTCTACSRPINGVVAAASKEDSRLAAGRDHLLSKARERFHALLKMPVHHRTPLSAQSEIILHMIHCL